MNKVSTKQPLKNSWICFESITATKTTTMTTVTAVATTTTNKTLN